MDKQNAKADPKFIQFLFITSLVLLLLFFIIFQPPRFCRLYNEDFLLLPKRILLVPMFPFGEKPTQTSFPLFKVIVLPGEGPSANVQFVFGRKLLTL
jgi:hypothetical protein